jgi:integrase
MTSSTESIFTYAMGKKFGLRAKDMLSLRWEDVIGKEQLVIKESKTGKVRNIPIAKDTQKSIQLVFKELKPEKNRVHLPVMVKVRCNVLAVHFKATEVLLCSHYRLG